MWIYVCESTFFLLILQNSQFGFKSSQIGFDNSQFCLENSQFFFRKFSVLFGKFSSLFGKFSIWRGKMLFLILRLKILQLSRWGFQVLPKMIYKIWKICFCQYFWQNMIMLEKQGFRSLQGRPDSRIVTRLNISSSLRRYEMNFNLSP